MREIVTLVRLFCDFHRESERVDATTTFTVAMTTGEGEPGAPKIVMACDRHAGPLTELFNVEGEDWPRDAPRATVKPRRQVPTEVCEICQETLPRPLYVAHLYEQHTDMKRPAQPTVCPECGKQLSSGQATNNHRIKMHGYDPVAEALALTRRPAGGPPSDTRWPAPPVDPPRPPGTNGSARVDLVIDADDDGQRMPSGKIIYPAGGTN